MMKVPVVCWLRDSPRSRYGTVLVDMCTTTNVLSLTGQSAIRKLLQRSGPQGTGLFSAVGCRWDRIAASDHLLSEVYRAAVRLGFCEPDMKLLRQRRSAFDPPGRVGLPVPIRRAIGA